MKKILSLVVVVMLLVSAIPTAFAEEFEFTGKTTVTLYGDNVDNYEVNVPAFLEPGQSGTVSVSGKWASDKTMTVTCPDTVTLYYGDQSMNVGIEFTDIALVGSDVDAVSTTSTVAVEDASVLFGTWTGVLEYNVELVEEEAQIITFTYKGTEYQAEEGMTWEEWVNSEYNTDSVGAITELGGVTINGQIISIDGYVNPVKTDVIMSGHEYSMY